MSFDIWTFIADENLTAKKYYKFLNECSRIESCSKLIENQDFNLNEEWQIHQCGIHNLDIDDEDELYQEKSFSVWLDLWKHIYHEEHPDIPAKYRYIIKTETGMGRSLLSSKIQLLIPKIAADIFEEIIIVPDNYPDGSKYFYTSDEYLNWAKLLPLRWIDREQLATFGCLDKDGYFDFSWRPDNIVLDRTVESEFNKIFDQELPEHISLSQIHHPSGNILFTFQPPFKREGWLEDWDECEPSGLFKGWGNLILNQWCTPNQAFVKSQSTTFIWILIDDRQNKGFIHIV